MNDVPREHRVTVANALASSATENEETDGALLLGYVAVSEFMDKEGERWLTVISGSGQGDSVSKWQTRGYLHEALFCWPDEEAE